MGGEDHFLMGVMTLTVIMLLTWVSERPGREISPDLNLHIGGTLGARHFHREGNSTILRTSLRTYAHRSEPLWADQDINDNFS